MRESNTKMDFATKKTETFEDTYLVQLTQTAVVFLLASTELKK